VSTPGARQVAAVFTAKSARTLCYGFLGIALPVYLADLGLGAIGIGASVTLALVGSALLTWAVRRPAERHGARAALLALSALSAVAALVLLTSREPWLVVVGMMIGNVAVGTGETGPFLTVEQVVVARAVTPARRTAALSLYNVIGYAAGALGAALAGRLGDYRILFLLFLAGAVVQAVAYVLLPAGRPVKRPAAAALPSRPLIRRMAGLFALDAFAGGFVLQSLVAYYLYQRFGLDLATLGGVFAGTQVLTAASLLLAAPVAARIGLLPTMVLSHLVSNVVLIAIAFAPSVSVAVALLLTRHLLSQMDVPTRQAWVMAVVADHEREAASSATNLARTMAQAVTPAVTGWVMHAVALAAPFVLGGSLKIVYDLLLFWTFKDVKLHPDP
jgi:MFS family permease